MEQIKTMLDSSKKKFTNKPKTFDDLVKYIDSYFKFAAKVYGTLILIDDNSKDQKLKKDIENQKLLAFNPWNFDNKLYLKKIKEKYENTKSWLEKLCSIKSSDQSYNYVKETLKDISNLDLTECMVQILVPILKKILTILNSFDFDKYLKNCKSELKEKKIKFGEYEKVGQVLENKERLNMARIFVIKTNEKHKLTEKVMFLNSIRNMTSLFEEAIKSLSPEDYILCFTSNSVSTGDSRYRQVYTLNSDGSLDFETYDNQRVVVKLKLKKK